MNNIAQGKTPQAVLWEWRCGRAESGYSKLLLMGVQPYFDLYLLKYPKGSYIPKHKDPVHERKHYRVNLEIKKAKSGGIFTLEGKPTFKLGPLVMFNSGECWHSVSKIKEGVRYALSFGFTRRGRE